MPTRAGRRGPRNESKKVQQIEMIKNRLYGLVYDTNLKKMDVLTLLFIEAMNTKLPKKPSREGYNLTNNLLSFLNNLPRSN